MVVGWIKTLKNNNEKTGRYILETHGVLRCGMDFKERYRNNDKVIITARFLVKVNW